MLKDTTWREAMPIALLASLVAVLFRGVLFGGRIFYERDIHTTFFPFGEIFRRMVHAGTLPLWNPYMSFGQPLLADPHFEIFYPLTWLLAVVSPPTYYTIFVILHLLLGATAVYLLCRTLGLSRAACWMGGAVWLLSGPVLSAVNLWQHLPGTAWIPCVLLAVERFVRRPVPGRAVVWGIVAALQLFTGSADMALLAASAAVLRVAVAAAGTSGARARARLFGLTVLAGVIAAGLASAQWLPTMAMAQSSARGLLTPADRTFWSVHPLVMLQTVLPVPLHELHAGRMVRERLFESREPFLASLYLGLPAAALVAAAVADRASPWRRYAILLIVVAGLGALGRFAPAYGVFTTVVPVFKLLRYPYKAMELVAVPWAVMAAAGVDACRRSARASRIAMAVGAVGAVGAAGLALTCAASPPWLERWFDLVPGESVAEVLYPARQRLWASAGLALVVAALTGLHRRGSRLPYGVLAGACVAADLMAFHAGLNTTAPGEFYAYRPAALPLLPGRQWARVYVFDYDIPSRIAEVARNPPDHVPAYQAATPPAWLHAAAARSYPFPSVLGTWAIESSYDSDQSNFYPAHLALLTRFMRVVEGKAAQTRLLQLGAVDRVVSLHAQAFEALPLLARRASLFRAPVLVFGVPDALPRTYVATRARAAEGMAAVDAILSDDFRIHDDVAISRGPVITPAVASPAPDSTPAPPGWSRVAAYRPDRIRLEAEAPVGGYVVLVDTYDRGWKATVDGQPAEILRANIAFRAVAVTPGRHVVDLVYRPRPLAWGLAVSALTLASLLVGAAGFRRARRKADVVSAAGERYDLRPPTRDSP